MTGRELYEILKSNNELDNEIIIGCEGYILDQNDELGVYLTKDNKILLADSCGAYEEKGII